MEVVGQAGHTDRHVAGRTGDFEGRPVVCDWDAFDECGIAREVGLIVASGGDYDVEGVLIPFLVDEAVRCELLGRAEEYGRLGIDEGFDVPVRESRSSTSWVEVQWDKLVEQLWFGRKLLLHERHDGFPPSVQELAVVHVPWEAFHGEFFQLLSIRSFDRSVL